MGALYGLLLLMGGVEVNPGPSGRTNDRPKGALRFGALNVRSAANKSADIHHLIESENLDVLALCETWFQVDTPDAIKSDTAPPGFSITHRYRTTRKTKGRKTGLVKGGGGISLIYRDNLKITNIEKELYHGLNSSSGHTFESLAVMVGVEKLGINLVVIYRPPSTPSSEFFLELSGLLDSTDLLRSDTIICGDFNCPGVSKCEIDVRLEKLIADHNLVQFIKSSTRKQDGNVLDLIITRPDGVISEPPAVSEVSFSDHNLVVFSSYIIRHHAIAQSFVFRDIKKLDTQAFCNIMSRSLIITSPPSSVDDYAAQLQSDVVAALDHLAPLKHRTKRVGRLTARWMSDDAKTLKREARRLERVYFKSRNSDDYAAYRRAGRLASKAIKAARADFYRNEI